MAAIVALCLAAVVAGRGLFILVAEWRRAARLVPTMARLTRNEMRSEWVTNQFQQNDAQPDRVLETVHTIEWEYEVAGIRHAGCRRSAIPLDQRPPSPIEVLYDRADPSVSRLRGETAATEAMPWFIFAGVILAVGVAIALISAWGA